MTNEAKRDIDIAIAQIESEIASAQRSLESALSWMENAIANARRDLKNIDNSTGNAYVQSLGSDVDAASARLGSAVKARRILVWLRDGGVKGTQGR